MDQKKKNQPYSNSVSNKVETLNGMVPPQAPELEIIVLGACMLERDAFHKIEGILTKEMFYRQEHQIIFGIIDDMVSANRSVDIVTLTQHAMQIGLLEKIGGPLYITQLTSTIASAGHIEAHARILYEKFVQREMIRRCSELISMAYTESFDEMDMAYSMNTQAIDDLLAGKTGMRHIKEVLRELTKEIEERERKAKTGQLPGISTGLVDLDKATFGWQPSDLIIIGARPGMGKTAFALHFAKFAAKKDFSVCIFSLEMSDLRLTQRLSLSNGGIDQSLLKSGNMTKGDWDAYHRSVGQLEQLPIYIDDTPAATVRYISAVARNKARRGDCKMVVIDYLQLVETPSDGYQQKNREREVAEISRGLKKLAKEINIPVILLVQLNRNVESRTDKTPMLSDLRESGAIEQDADMVIFPWRPEYYDPNGVDENDNSIKNICQLVIAKNREGNIRTITCKKSDDFTQIYDWVDPRDVEDYYSKEKDNDVPY